MDFVETCLDEIALEGLDGITIEALWLRLGVRKPAFPLHLDDYTKEYLWENVIVPNTDLEFFKLPTARKRLILYDRFDYTDKETGLCIEQDKTPEDIYPVVTVQEEGVCGSCGTYKSRKNITDAIRTNQETFPTLENALTKWGSSLVIVASQERRNISLFGMEKNANWHKILTPKVYCFVERIARSRYFGEVTHGKKNLMESLHENSKTIFYMRNKLKKYKLIKAQCFNQRLLKGINVSGKLLHLARFFVERKPIYLGWLEKMSMILESRPNQRELLPLLRDEMCIKEAPFKKLYSLGAKYVQTKTLLYREYYPDAPFEKYMTKGKSKERTVRVVQLVKPFRYSSADVEDEDEDIENGEDEMNETMDMTYTTQSGDVAWNNFEYVLELPVMCQANKFVMSKGEGVSQIQMCAALGYGKLEGRQLCRNLEKRGAVKRIMWDEGRQRVQRYVSVAHVATSSIHTKLQAESKKILQHNTPKSTTSGDADVENATSLDASSLEIVNEESTETETEVKDEDNMIKSFFEDPSFKKSQYSHYTSKNAHVTYRTLKRTNIILDAVKDNKLIDNLYLVQKKIMEIEANEGSNYRIDKKSMMRLLNRLNEKGQIKSIKTNIKIDVDGVVEEKELHFICDPNLSASDPLVKSAIDSARNKMMAAKRESQLKAPQAKSQVTPSYAVDASKPNHALLRSSIKVSDMEYDSEAGRRNGFLPRMKRVQMVHQFLWYLLYGYGQSESQDGGEDPEGSGPCKLLHSCQGKGQLSGSNTEQMSSDSGNGGCSDEVIAKLKVYVKEVSWKRFIPPLPKHTGYGKGWCLIGDVLLLLPVYMFCQVIRINFKIRGLVEYLNDPIKRNIPVCQLPSYIRQCLMYERKYIFCFYDITRLMAQLGLLSFGVRELKEKEQIFIYIHKVCLVIDTTIPGEKEDRPVKRFRLDSFSDVNGYWFTLQFVCLNTPLENMTLPDPASTKSSIPPDRFKECLRGKACLEIVDEGNIPGDGLGAGGVDSTFWSHLKRNWSQASDLDLRVETMVTDANNTRSVSSKGKVDQRKIDQEPVVQSRKVNTKKGKKRKQELPESTYDCEDVPEKRVKKGPFKHTITQASKEYAVVVKPCAKPAKGGKGVKRKARESLPGLVAKKKKPERSKPKKRNYSYDAVDQMALNKMTMERVTWASEEDSLLLLCQVAQVFLCGTRRDFVVNYGVIRDILHRNIQKSQDKTSKACGRRLKYVMKNPQTCLNVRMYVGEANQDKELVREFKSGKRYVKTDTGNTAVFVKVVNRLREKYKSSLETSSVTFTLPPTLEELHSRYRISKEPLPKKIVHKDVSSLKDIYSSVLQNLIHSSMVLSDKMGRAHELYQLYNQYPEDLLFEVFNNMKNAGIITKVKKNAVNTPITMGTYQLAQRYNYHWHSRYPRTIFENAAVHYRNLVSSCIEADGKTENNGEMETDNSSGACIVTVTLMAQRKISFRTKLPEQIIVIDNKKMAQDEARFEKVKKRNLTLSDSDEEEEALIEEAEKERPPVPENTIKNTRSENGRSLRQLGDSSVFFDTRFQASRFLLSLARGQYVTSTRNLNPSDNLVVNACTVKIKLRADVIAHTPQVFTGNSRDIMIGISSWNNSNTQLHPKTCFLLLKSLRGTQPARIVLENVLEKLKSQYKYQDQDVKALTEIYEYITESGSVGATIPDIKMKFCMFPMLGDYINQLVDQQVVAQMMLTVHKEIFILGELLQQAADQGESDS